MNYDEQNLQYCFLRHETFGYYKYSQDIIQTSPSPIGARVFNYPPQYDSEKTTYNEAINQGFEPILITIKA